MLIIALAVFLAFLPTLGNGFVSWDDQQNFVDNTAYRGLGVAQLRWMWSTTLLGHYVPLSWMSLGLDYVLWGMNPAGYHLTSLLIHVLNTVLLFFITRRLLWASGARRLKAQPRRIDLAAAAAALLSAIHPLRVESVAWVTERRDVVSYFFYLSSFLAYLRATESSRTRARWYTVAVALFVCAVLSKATAMTMPALLFAVNLYPLRRLGGSTGWGSVAARRVYAELVPFALVASGTAVTSILVLHPPGQLPIQAKIAVSAYSLVFYAWKTLVPVRLSPLYEMPRHIDVLGIRFIGCYIVALAAGLATWMNRRKRPALAIALATFIILLLPTLGIVQNGPQIAADRYTYYAAPAVVIPIAGYAFSFEHPAERALTISIGVVIAALGSLTWNQTTIWHDSRSLWTAALRLDDSSSYAHVGLAKAAFESGDIVNAIRHYRRAVEIDPTYDEGFNNLGNALARQGRIDEAIDNYRRALALTPTFAEAHNDLGSALVQKGDVAAAIEQFRAATATKPEYAEAHNNWGVALARLGQVGLAIEHYRQAVLIDSTYAAAYTNWGNALVRLGKPEEAQGLYASALHFQPNSVDAHRNLGVALAQQGKMAEASDQFRAALDLRPGDEELIAYLARASAQRDSARSTRHSP